jgi:hypothetical protein
MTPHTCHARGCALSVPPELLMCHRHWQMVPREIQRRVRATYRPRSGEPLARRLFVVALPRPIRRAPLVPARTHRHVGDLIHYLSHEAQIACDRFEESISIPSPGEVAA